MLRSRYLSLAVLLSAPLLAVADDWPQWLGPQRDAVWREDGIIDTFPDGGPEVLWRVPIGEGFAGPAVADGKVFVTDRIKGTGGSGAGTERVLCLDEKTGKTLWKHEYDRNYQRLSYNAGPRCTPTVDGDRVYTLGAMGDLYCFNVADGEVNWSKQFMDDYGADVPIWGFCGHPLIDGDKLICLVGGSKSRGVIAFDKKTGGEIWASQNLAPGNFGYSPPVIHEVGGRRVLINWHPEAIDGLDPETGKRLWSVPFEIRAGLTAPMPRFDAGRLLVTSFYNGPMMLKLSEDATSAEILWRGNSSSERPDRTDKLHSIIPTPWFEGDHIYGVCSYGELRCLKADTGARVWETFEATAGKSVRWANAFLIKHGDEGDRFFLFNDLGDLIIADLTPEGYHEIDRAHLLDPTNRQPGRPVVWMHPAFANGCMVGRNDREIIRVNLKK